MSLPIIFDITLGVIFLFLILSLLASELQELLSTLLQWRAEHLKKSIEILLTGNAEEVSTYQTFIDNLYSSPLMRSLNQEAKGTLPRLFRRVSRNIGALYRRVTGDRNVFGNQFSGPSYIPSKTFADALLQQLDVESLTQKISDYTMRRLGEEKLALVEDILKSLRNSVGDDSLLEAEFEGLRQRLRNIRDDFRSNRISLSRSMDLATEQIRLFIDSTEAYLKNNNHCQDIILGRLPYLKQAVQMKKLEPTIGEVMTLVLNNRGDLPAELEDAVIQVRSRVSQLPPHLRQNLSILANQAQMRSDGLQDGLRKLEQEVENWFNRSMDRASGVYKRNAKGVAIILGILLAAATNADTFLVVDRLSRDSAIRAAVSESANQLLSQSPQAPTRFREAFPTSGQPLPIPNSPNVGESSFDTLEPGGLPPDTTPIAPATEASNLQQELADIRDAVDTVLDDIPLPIGWSKRNRLQQFPPNTSLLISIPKRILGWLITGIAISMGSSFWFDLLSKVVRVRNAGTPSFPNDHRVE
ncbi:hypothetical protein [Thermoleptolyngbya sp. C42_A2020_037]|uniref:hypothetical protein n=1 Tax=Thermoleptolyngbya sp. C42_A2020_037 TaxID=2747799 RepID=UPI001A064B7B|nr:hypothetical protein [Thermoleptolyngbya sp. C42_A2020_037]MBF2083513.1 hypothetical protein [Thermoleptolyngbya sp. C42_A2020_037]